ncbi:MAG TPA: homogentisate 1,2-dioxygenase [Nitriliruptorales bacterium]
MPQYRRGATSRQAHVALPAGTVEEEHGREGFYGRVSHLYRANPPTGWTSIDGTLRPRALDCNDLAPGDARALRTELLVNDDVRIGAWQLDEDLPFFYRNADGDDLLFVHRGQGVLETDYGPLDFGAGDYLVVPRGTTYRPTVSAPTYLYTIQTTGEVHPPDRGLLGPNALWDESVLRIPDVDPHDESGDFEVVIKREGELTSVRYPFHPLDVVGWKGDLTPFALSVRDIRPVMSPGYHLPPSAHTTFQADGAVVCTFLPRPLESDPEAVKVPFYHRNIDYDETIFYHEGDFFSRSGIHAGMLTWHPQGIHHGPHPKAVKAVEDKQRTDEIAVMLDARRPLRLTGAAQQVEAVDYWASWQE